MATYEESTGKGAPAWPYPIKYGEENEASFDVLILGGGIAGCHAAINAAKKGAKVAIVEKAATLPLNFNLTDYPVEDPAEWNKFITTINWKTAKLKLASCPQTTGCCRLMRLLTARTMRRTAISMNRQKIRRRIFLMLTQ